MQQNSRECEERNKQLREEREHVQKHFQELKAEMNHCREQERTQLTTLTLQSNAAIKKLNTLVLKIYVYMGVRAGKLH